MSSTNSNGPTFPVRHVLLVLLVLILALWPEHTAEVLPLVLRAW